MSNPDLPDLPDLASINAQLIRQAATALGCSARMSQALALVVLVGPQVQREWPRIRAAIHSVTAPGPEAADQEEARPEPAEEPEELDDNN